MDTKKVNVADAARRGARGRGSLNFVIISAMGLAAATALTGAAAAVGAAPSGSDGRAMNSFVVVEGEGVRVADDGSIHFPNAKSPVSVEVTARPGWKVNGRKSLSLTRAPGEGGTLRVTSDLGEDSGHVPFEDCVFDSVEYDEHVMPPVISAVPDEGHIIKMYALPESNILVSASASCEDVMDGAHYARTYWLPCPTCRAVHDPEEECAPLAVASGPQLWTASGAGIATNSNVWSGYMTKGTGQTISFSVVATNECPECVCSAATNVVVDVHELSVQREDYIGLDRTDAGRANPRANAKTATAQVSPGPSGTVTCSWTDCGICSFIEPTDQQSVQYFAPNPDTASGSYLAEKLKVTATIVDGDQTASATCTTNFTVVKVDVGLGNWGELMDEKNDTIIGSYVKRSGGMIGGYPDLAKQAMTQVPVSIEIFPDNLPLQETVSLDFADNNLIVNDNPEVAKTSYAVKDIKGQGFFLFDESGVVGKKSVAATHDESSAKDKIAYDVCCCKLTVYSDISQTSSSSNLGSSSFHPGHAFWLIDMDEEHKMRLPSDLRNLVGAPLGFCVADPNGSVLGSPGIIESAYSHFLHVQDDELSGTAGHSWHISYDGCINGLRLVRRMIKSPPNYNVVTYNCVVVAKEVAAACGVERAIVVATPVELLGNLWFLNANFGEEE